MKCSYCVDVGYQKFHGFRSLLFDIKVLFLKLETVLDMRCLFSQLMNQNN